MYVCLQWSYNPCSPCILLDPEIVSDYIKQSILILLEGLYQTIKGGEVVQCSCVAELVQVLHEGGREGEGGGEGGRRGRGGRGEGRGEGREGRGGEGDINTQSSQGRCDK